MKRDYSRFENWKNLVVFGVVIGILLGITLDVWIQKGTEPILYSVEAHEEEPEEILIEVRYNWTKDRIKKEVDYVASKYGVSVDKLWNTVLCENPQLDPSLQSLIVKDGIREDSWGLAQFHLPSKNRTPEGVVITKEMAQNPKIALDAMAWHFSIGNARLWTCYRNLYL